MQEIEDFCGYFERQLEVITRLDVDWGSLPNVAPEDYQTRFYRKALLVVGIDTLAGVRFPRTHFPGLNRNNRERFTRFVTEVARWSDGERVSAPFLIERMRSPQFADGPLKRHLLEKLSPFDVTAGGQIGASEVDESAEELLAYATSEKEEIAIYDLQHCSLLYRYRNRLIHESREPGSAMELDSLRSEPYYHGYLNDERWYLVYPMQLLTDVYKAAVDGLKSYLLANSLNPYDFVEETSRW
jgi:hypothetical protein